MFRRRRLLYVMDDGSACSGARTGALLSDYSPGPANHAGVEDGFRAVRRRPCTGQGPPPPGPLPRFTGRRGRTAAPRPRCHSEGAPDGTRPRRIPWARPRNLLRGCRYPAPSHGTPPVAGVRAGGPGVVVAANSFARPWLAPRPASPPERSIAPRGTRPASIAAPSSTKWARSGSPCLPNRSNTATAAHPINRKPPPRGRKLRRRPVSRIPRIRCGSAGLRQRGDAPARASRFLTRSSFGMTVSLADDGLLSRMTDFVRVRPPAQPRKRRATRM
jgi:hypothetical protein